MTYRTHLSSEINEDMAGKEVVIAGWVHAKRDLGGKKFLIVRDKDGYIQVVIDKRGFDEIEGVPLLSLFKIVRI